MFDRGRHLSTDELLANFPADRCDRHVDRTLQLFCNTCRKPLCVACSVDATHRTHDKDEVYSLAVMSSRDILSETKSFAKIQGVMIQDEPRH